MPETDTDGFRSCYDKLRKAAKIDNLSSAKISEIVPNLYLAGRTVAQNSELLSEKNVTTVINVSDREIPHYPQSHPSIRHYKFYPTSDTANAKFDAFLEEAIRLIHESRLHGNGVLVHCFLGVSRSATLVAFYLISIYGMTWKDAVDFVRQRRVSANPNFGFLHQLKKAKDFRHRLTSDRCAQMRKSDAEFIKNQLPLAVIQL
uniref:Protein-serine/threonine phosphatase n=1 Tax=Caenorhabditis japonica TaxID=281687 RepID=A0A8R1HYB3_CAEJA